MSAVIEAEALFKNNPEHYQELLSERWQLFHDPTMDKYDRGHAHYAYWILFAGMKQRLSFDELTDILKFSQEFPAEVDSIFYQLCASGRIEPAMTPHLKTMMTPGSFALNQLTALEMLHDSSIHWRDKYARAKDLKSKWALWEILRLLSPEDIDDARAFIASQAIGKKSMQQELSVLADVASQIPPR